MCCFELVGNEQIELAANADANESGKSKFFSTWITAAAAACTRLDSIRRRHPLEVKKATERIEDVFDVTDLWI